MTLRKMFTGLLCILILLISASCSNTNNVGLTQPDDQRGATGINVDSFEITRYNAAGFEDAALNPSIDAYVEQVGSEMALVIKVDDPDVERTVALNVEFDGVNMHYTRTEFHGLLGSEDQILEASFGLTDSVQLGQTAIRDYDPGSVSGRFATLYFAPGASRQTSAVIGDVYKSSTGVLVSRCGDNPSFATFDNGDDTFQTAFTNAWMMADGDQNGQCTIADITPIGIYLNQSCEANPLATRADYDNNGTVTISELTPLGVHLNEGVSGYTVGLRDDGDTTTTLASEKSVDPSADAISALAGPDVTDMRTIFRHYDVGALFSQAEIDAVDVGGQSGIVELCVVPSNTNGDGTLACIEFGGGGNQIITNEIVITNFDIQMVGVSGGSGDPDNIFDNNIAGGSVEANADVSFQVNTIEGTFDGLDFDSTTLADGMTQDHYDQAAQAVRDNATWTFGGGGAAGIRGTSVWVHDGTGADISGTGDPGPGVVFPDYDPESDEFSPEGTLSVFLGATADLAQGTIGSNNYKVVVLSDRDYNWTVDVTKDPSQAEFGPILQPGFDPIDEYKLVVGTRAFARDLDWGDPGVPVDLSSVELEIWQYIGGPLPNCVRVNDFTFTEETPATGQFTIRSDEEPDTYLLEYVVNGAQLQGSSQYVIRMFNGVTWSSINMPENKTIPSGPAPAAADLTSIPNAGGYKGDANVNFLQIIYPDPKIRRWSDVFADPETESVEVQKGFDNDGNQVDKTLAFNDILRTNGDEFAIFTTPIDSPQGFSIWPQVLIKNFTETGSSDVTSADIPLATPSGPIYWSAAETASVIIVQHGLGRIVCDIQALPTDDGAFGPINYGFGLFTPQGVDFLEVGEGSFTMSPISNIVKPAAVNWGIDAFDREERDLDNGDYSNHIINGNFVNDPVQPYVMWVEFTGGHVFDWSQNEEKVWKVNSALDNIYLQVKDVDQPADIRMMEVGLRLIGTTPTGTFLAIHTITNRDFVKIPAPPPSQTWGILSPGHSYEVSIQDRLKGGDSFGTNPSDLLTVIGSNPNL